jgi:NAD(P)-dependent dehydrogenase (short-subunit alcohol dehydrogenase family)
LGETRIFDETIKRFGAIDVAVNTTGMVIKKPILNCTEEDYDKIFAINSKAAFFFLPPKPRCALTTRATIVPSPGSV